MENSHTETVHGLHFIWNNNDNNDNNPSSAQIPEFFLIFYFLFFLKFFFYFLEKGIEIRRELTKGPHSLIKNRFTQRLLARDVRVSLTKLFPAVSLGVLSRYRLSFESAEQRATRQRDSIMGSSQKSVFTKKSSLRKTFLIRKMVQFFKNIVSIASTGPTYDFKSTKI